MNLTFRKALVHEVASVADLVNKAYRPGEQDQGWTHESDLVEGPRTSAQQIRQLFGTDSAVLVGNVGPRLVACVHVKRQESVAYIGMLATHPSMQACGLGKQMLLFAEDFARKTFHSSAFQMSVLIARTELVKFYERRGYEMSSELAEYPHHAGIGQAKLPDLKVGTMRKSSAP